MSSRHLLLTFMVTEDGEPGLPMDHIVTRIDLTEDDGPAAESIEKLIGRIKREVTAKAARRA